MLSCERLTSRKMKKDLDAEKEEARMSLLPTAQKENLNYSYRITVSTVHSVIRSRMY